MTLTVSVPPLMLPTSIPHFSEFASGLQRVLTNCVNCVIMDMVIGGVRKERKKGVNNEVDC